MERVVSDTPAQKAGEALTEQLLILREHPVLLLLSGGSAFRLLDYVDQMALGSNLTVGVLDERFSFDPQVNNFSQLSRTDFFTRALVCGVSVIDTHVKEGETRSAFAARVEHGIRSWTTAYPQGIVIVTMGVGEDGHTAGILPRVEESLFMNDAWVTTYAVDSRVNQYTERVTVTYTFLRTVVDFAFVYVTGSSKKNALAAVFQNDGDIFNTPARILHDMKNVYLYTDCA